MSWKCKELPKMCARVRLFASRSDLAVHIRATGVPTGLGLSTETSMSALEERIDTTGGLKIFVRSWKPEAKPRAVVVICHGVNSHGGQYIWPGEQFAKRDFAVYALDLRGRGQSD